MDQVTITSAAIKTGDLILSMARPARHGDIFRAMGATGADMPLREETQGFMTSAGLFVNREVAMLLARAAGQLRYPETRKHSRELFSEDLW